MNGWVTWLGAIISILSGVGTLCNDVAGLLAHFVNPSSSIALDPDTAVVGIHTALGLIVAGVGLIGIGRKLDKNTDAVKATKV